MRNIFLFIAAIFLLKSNISNADDKNNYLSQYDLIWDSPSKNSYESMPVGGGDIGLNVWVENGELLFYIGQSGTFDENNQMLKHGRVRVNLSPNPFENYSSFKQHLNLKRGDMSIHSLNMENDVKIHIWVDVFKPIINLSIESKEPTKIVAQYETWRFEDRELLKIECHSCFSRQAYPGVVTKYKDDIIAGENNIKWMHRNKNEGLVRDFCIEQQGLSSVASQITDTQTGRTFGGEMWSHQMKNTGVVHGEYMDVPYHAYQLETKNNTKNCDITIALNCGIYSSAEDWTTTLNSTKESAEKSLKSHNAQQNNLKWWSDFWNRSYIVMNNSKSLGLNKQDSVWRIGRNYQVFRYMLACNAYGDYPSKFNGSFFTVDPFDKEPNKYAGIDPDFRCWGGGSFTAQNQRLVYWPMLKSGDFDMMKPQFDFYERILSSAEARTKIYWNHEGACFTEQLENFGLPFAGGWGFDSGVRKRKPETEFGVQTNEFISHHYTNQLEFAFMILEYYFFTKKDISKYMPFIKSSVIFFDEHYRYRNKKTNGTELDSNGKLVFYPSTACETYKLATNPTDVIAALISVTDAIGKLPSKFITESERQYFKNLGKIIPPIPFDVKDGKKVIKPAEDWKEVKNTEMPELYTLFPYNLYSLGRDNIDIARDTWYHGESIKYKYITWSWSQVPIFAARLGLADEASVLLTKKMDDASNRVPAFWGPGFDWTPDFNHGGSGMITLQEMLMQTVNEDKIYLFPAWKKEWDVKFKLHAPQNTIVEVELKDGKIKNLAVSPKSRMKDIEIMLER